MEHICHSENPVPTVKAVTATPDYMLHLTFGNGETRIYDARPLLTKNIFFLYESLHFSCGLLQTAVLSLGTMTSTSTLVIFTNAVLQPEVQPMSEQCSALIDRIIVLRKAKGLSQKELSARCGMTQSVIARIERKKSTPTISTFVKIADALGAKHTISSVE